METAGHCAHLLPLHGEPPYECLAWNAGLLQGQQVLLTTELSLSLLSPMCSDALLYSNS